MELIDSILLYREKKEDFIKKYIDKYQVITLRSNVVGINKCLKESYILLSYFDRLIEQYSLKKFVFDNADGPFVIYLCSKDECLKNKMVFIEENNPLGRFVDIDVYYNSQNSLSRNNKELRKCYLCDNPAFVCGRMKRHTLDEVNNYLIKKIEEVLKKQIYDLCIQCMSDELNLHPKFGLVTPYSNGSHSDMNYQLMKDSQFIIAPYFEKMFLESFNSLYSVKDIFNKIRNIGVESEIMMFQKTNNVNTYKGLIFALGLIVSSVGIKLNNLKNSQSIFDYVKEMTKGISNEVINSSDTFGKIAYQEYGLKGARHQAESGYIDVQKIVNDIDLVTDLDKLKALWELIVNVDDTVFLKRCKSIEKYNYVKRLFKETEFNEENINKLTDYCIENNYSFGGCADLLIVSFFIKKINRLFNFDLFLKLDNLIENN